MRTYFVDLLRPHFKDEVRETDQNVRNWLNGPPATLEPASSGGARGRPGEDASRAALGSTPTQAVWFGQDHAPLFGLVDAAGSKVRGAVVLCHSLGREHVVSYQTVACLARALAESGFVVLRFDYRSTGDSSDRPPSTGPSDGLIEDVRCAVGYARRLGGGPVSLVGLRVGGLLAGFASRLEPVDAAVLWDPCISGRSFLREQRALSLGIPTASGLEGTAGIPGLNLHPGIWSELSDLELTPDATSMARRVLVLTRKGRSTDHKLVERLQQLPHVEHRTVTGQAELLDVPTPMQEVPSAGIDEIVGWLATVAPASTHDVAIPDGGAASLVVAGVGEAGTGPESIPIVEEALRLGPSQLFAISSSPEHDPLGPPVIFFSVANEHRIGPSRLWVDISRRLAVRGFRCIRVDLGEAGDSPPRTGRAPYDVYSYAAVEEISDVATAAGAGDSSDAVLVGLCSSAYHVLEAAARLGPRGVLAINPMVTFPAPEASTDAGPDPRRQFSVGTSQATVLKANVLSLGWMEQRVPGIRRATLRYPEVSLKLRHMVRRTDAVASRPFRSLRWVGTKPGDPRDRPAKHLAELVRAGTDALLVCGVEEMRPFRGAVGHLAQGSEARGTLRLEMVPELDHALRRTEDLERVSDIVVGYVEKLFTP